MTASMNPVTVFAVVVVSCLWILAVVVLTVKALDTWDRSHTLSLALGMAAIMLFAAAFSVFQQLTLSSSGR